MPHFPATNTETHYFQGTFLQSLLVSITKLNSTQLKSMKLARAVGNTDQIVNKPKTSKMFYFKNFW